MPTFIGIIEAGSLKALSLRSWKDGRLRQKIINFPSLQHLVLTDISEVLCPDLSELSQTFPNIERLTWNVEEGIIKSVEETLTYILRNIRGTGELMKWLHLHTIEISIAEGRLEPRHDGPALSAAILELEQSNHLIRKLRLPAAFINSASQEDLASLRALVALEEFYDDWPTPFAGGVSHSMRQPNEARRQHLLLLLQELAGFANERLKLLRQLEDLDARERPVKLEHAALQNLDSPTSNRPDEVLSMIFLAGMGQEDVFPEPYFGELVSHISSHWRRVALSTPRLWENVEMRVVSDTLDWEEMRSTVLTSDEKERWNSTAMAERNRRKDRSAAYLSRSRSCPVNIFIKCTDEQDALLDFFDLISDHIAGDIQWQERILSSSTPLLKSVELVDIMGNHHLLSQPAFASVTSLRLTNFDIDGLGQFEAFRTGLMQLKSLNHLELKIKLINWNIVDLSWQTALLPTVRFLHLEGHSDPAPWFLDLIDATSVEVLSIGYWWNRTLELTDTQFPSLQHLILTEGYMPYLRPDALLGGLPRVEQLTFKVDFRDGSFAYTLARILQQDGPGGPAWPRLHTVSIEGEYLDKRIEAAVDLATLIN
ncbi:hypothetical protein HWV62_22287 [Athelia sp. TMB]|nr:hypothetical protein HWV62_22287 [Athelia sp. TMB]